MFRFILIALLILPLAGCLEEKVDDIYRLSIETASGKKHKFNIELAQTPQEQMRGLMHRTEMAEDAGMLFIFETEREARFWMKNTLIPLDMIFIRADGTIHRIHENATPHDLTGVPSEGPVKAILELNGGISAKLGLQKGDKILHTVFE